eukprot:CAMPEP_0118952750 /NCGR_PEP_ID=MMETSP1169-20130426/55401_1 /TAXON_ID=36882 /ORGANISM="Pyramimonas obovata, Strain CCMP722" /LENGTH=68 /DNA_ID=CAMNT_0006900069 /DNA_START=126 /DNA_END=328 /DNA_ORIENTATION=+
MAGETARKQGHKRPLRICFCTRAAAATCVLPCHCPQDVPPSGGRRGAGGALRGPWEPPPAHVAPAAST